MNRLPLLLIAVVGWIVLPARAATYTITGSKTMYLLNTALAADYQKSRPDVRLKVMDDGTTKGIASVVAGEADAAASTRPLNKEETEAVRKRLGRDLIPHVVALEGVSVYLHPRNPVNALSVEQLGDILSGRVTNWKAVGGLDAPIRVHSFSSHTGRYYYMVESVLGGGAFARSTVFCKATPNLAPHQRLAEEEHQMLEAVSNDPNAIGYGDLKKVRIVKIAAIRTPAGAYLPTPDHVKAGRYPLSRRLMYLVRPDAPKPLLDFVRWAPTRADIVREMNFAPVK